MSCCNPVGRIGSASQRLSHELPSKDKVAETGKEAVGAAAVLGPCGPVAAGAGCGSCAFWPAAQGLRITADAATTNGVKHGLDRT